MNLDNLGLFVCHDRAKIGGEKTQEKQQYRYNKHYFANRFIETSCMQIAFTVLYLTCHADMITETYFLPSCEMLGHGTDGETLV